MEDPEKTIETEEKPDQPSFVGIGMTSLALMAFYGALQTLWMRGLFAAAIATEKREGIKASHQQWDIYFQLERPIDVAVVIIATAVVVTLLRKMTKRISLGWIAMMFSVLHAIVVSTSRSIMAMAIGITERDGIIVLCAALGLYALICVFTHLDDMSAASSS